MRLTTLLALVGLVTVVRVMLGEGAGRAASLADPGGDPEFDPEYDDDSPYVQSAGPDSVTEPPRARNEVDLTSDESVRAGDAPAR